MIFDPPSRGRSVVIPIVPASTWNPADKAASLVLTNNDLTVTKPTGAETPWYTARGTVGKSTGSYKYETVFNVLYNVNPGIGICTSALNVNGDALGAGAVHYRPNGDVYVNGVLDRTIGAYTQGSTVSVEYSGTSVFFEVLGGAGRSTAVTIPAATYFPGVYMYNDTCKATSNFGGTAWAIAATSGFVGWPP